MSLFHLYYHHSFTLLGSILPDLCLFYLEIQFSRSYSAAMSLRLIEDIIKVTLSNTI